MLKRQEGVLHRLIKQLEYKRLRLLKEAKQQEILSSITAFFYLSFIKRQAYIYS
jgi:hypothetical protein